MTIDNKVVLFADILGFAELIESCPLDIDGLRSEETIAISIDRLLNAAENRLTGVFTGFHYTLRLQLQTARMFHPLTAFTFSDSVFVATAYLHESVKIAIDLLHSMLPMKIPIRIGVAYGSFAALRFRSDISADSGDHAAHFLGQSVVRAHIAETCGTKGLRILLHPSVMSLLDDVQHNPHPTSNPIPILKCSDSELEKNKGGVTHEINYWLFEQSTREAEAWRGLQDMWNQAPSSAMDHYEATAQAIDRMRISRGHEPLKKLRRRTLPK